MSAAAHPHPYPIPLATRLPVPRLPAPVSRLLQRGHAARMDALNRRARQQDLQALQALDARQCADAGIDRAALLPPQPTFALERGLVERLMALR